ncbi:MAG TPA: hypothetical protein DDW37_01150 [Verrucomicrobiales bacterium]|jgi:hypothetical protein|nr:hypothetical protein [Verrucomicrobiales bacterium]HBF16213.1 hypothetical protein [Verrucomicrobiales bacterium]HBI33441.1 hypothetical protein [Verrucomicrobiales bacterium]|tara:strand:+ start:252 stop:839 length:588 start_codon:yes stop_codon:yes gene_type:complete
MKLIPFLLAYLFSALLVTAQTTSSPGGQQNSTNQQQGQNEQDEKDKETLEGVNDDENRKRRWECSLPGGEYSVNLGAITSVSKHSYVLDGTLLVTEATVDTTGTALARFYYIEPITKDTTFNALARIQKRAEELRNRGQSRTGTKADEMAQKSYPTTTHARTIEFRIMNEVELNALYRSLYQAWTSGKGRTFRIQ